MGRLVPGETSGMGRARPSCAAVLFAVLVVAAACSETATPRVHRDERSQRPAPTKAPGTAAPSEGSVPGQGRLAGKRICVDPGHDAYWGAGATGKDRQGRVPVHPTEGIPLVEYELTLRVAYRFAVLLGQEGADVCVTRREDGTLQIEPYDFTGDGQVRPEGIAVEDGPERTQPRIDWANQFSAEILVSVHFNSLADRAARGTEVYYSDTGPQAERGRDLAEHLMSTLVDEMRAAGYPAVSRGVRSDRYQRYPPDVQAKFQQHNAATITKHGHDPNNCPDCQRIGVLGNNPMSLTPGTYVGALVEVEFLSNPDVVEDFLMRPDAVDIIATGLASGVFQYFHVA